MSKIAIILGILAVLALGSVMVTMGLFGGYGKARGESMAVEKMLATKEAEIATLKNENEVLKRSVGEARAYATFLSLALCPTLESDDKEALCVQDGAEWLNQTVQTGMSVPDDTIKENLNSFLQTLSSQKRPSSRQFYELLQPLEARALRQITEVLR